jgi:hypothetical protein
MCVRVHAQPHLVDEFGFVHLDRLHKLLVTFGVVHTAQRNRATAMTIASQLQLFGDTLLEQ